MKFVLRPWELMLIVLARWVNCEQESRIEYLQREVAVLKEHIGRKRILLTDEQRRYLAVKGKMIGRKGLDAVGSLFTPDTILRWHRLVPGSGTTLTQDRSNQVGQEPAKRMLI